MSDQTPIYNPLDKDFSYEMLDNNNSPVTHTIPSIDIAYFEKPIAEVLKKHLVDKICNEREVKSYDLESIDKIRKEVSVELD